MNNAPLVGKVSTRHWCCGCCISPSMRPALRRSAKRRERREWKRDVRLAY